jgi:hypothetical protein
VETPGGELEHGLDLLPRNRELLQHLVNAQPSSRFSKTIATSVRVPLNTQTPLTLPGMLSTAGHWDQSSEAIGGISFRLST